MSRQLPLLFVTLLSLTACSSATTPDSSSTTQALSEAAASEADAKATADACFDAYDTCRSGSTDVDTCRSQLKDCLPTEAHPGPHCGPPRGKGKGSPHGPHGESCDGGAPPANGQGGPGGPREPGDHDGAGRGPGGGADAGPEPPFCAKVPLPPPEAVRACHDTLDACLKGGTDAKTCFDADHACTKAAFDAAREGSNASTPSSDPSVN
jgi:hypothetical protein